MRRIVERGIDFRQVALSAGKSDAGLSDALCHLALSAPSVTCRQRTDLAKKRQRSFLAFFSTGVCWRGSLNLSMLAEAIQLPKE